MGVLETLILTTFLAGVAGTGLGGLVGALLQKNSNRAVSLLLSFAGGVMLGVVCFDLIVEAIEAQAGLLWVAFSVALGVGETLVLEYIGTGAKTVEHINQRIHFIPDLMPYAQMRYVE